MSLSKEIIQIFKSELWNLPVSWQWSHMSDISTIVGGGTPSTKIESNFGDDVPWITPADMSDHHGILISKGKRSLSLDGYEASGAQKMPAGTVLFSSRAPIGYVAIAANNLSTNQGFKSFIPDEGVNSKYIYYWLTNAKQYAEKLASGTTFLEISGKNAALLPIPVAPEKEQTRIVEKLEELLSDLDNGVAELKAAQAKLTQYRQSLLKSAVEGSLTTEWRSQNTPSDTGAQLLDRILKERRQRWEQQKLAEFKEKDKKPPKDWQKKYPEPVKPDTSNLPELPEGWVWASVDQCTKEARDITDGPFGSNLKTAHYTDAGPRVIRLQNIGDGEFFDDKAHISGTHYEKLMKHAFETGDTVIAMMGEILPRACSIPNGVAPGIVKADCARVRVNAEVLEPNLLPYFLNSQPIRNETKSLVKGIGRPRINLSHIRSMAIPISSYQEQMQILAAIRLGQDSIDRQSDELSTALVSLNAQRKNILKDAFSGELVEQDPNDEPASVLLGKIKAERALKEKQPKPKTSKKKAPPKVKQMPKLEDILKAQTNWIEAQQLFRECGISDNAETDQVEALYGELRDLDQANRLDIKREGNVDFIKLKAESVA